MRLKESHRKQLIGTKGEELAAQILVSEGYLILGRNFRTAYGEIDIIAQKDTQIVFVEVKTRTNRNYGYPEDSITQSKRSHMLSSADAYIQEQDGGITDWRIDVIAIDCTPAGQICGYEWFENAIT